MIRIITLLIISLAFSCQSNEKKPQLTPIPMGGPMCFEGNKTSRHIDAKAMERIMAIPSPKKKTSLKGMVLISGTSFNMGADDRGQTGLEMGAYPRTDESPKHEVILSDFYMDVTEVTNAQFAKFVKATGYVTTAELKIEEEEILKQLPPGAEIQHPELLLPGSLVFAMPTPKANLQNLDWWQFLPGASWKHPEGPESNIKGKGKSPVVHISWYDAKAYAKWVGKELPTEAQWEYASRGGKNNEIFPWGGELSENPEANYWQGNFPYHNLKTDGYEGPAPVKSFPKNGFGLYDMAGNVWEWCEDWYHADYYACRVENDNTVNPKGPSFSYDPALPGMAQKVMRGGSFLCNDSYCSGYRNASRMKSSPDTGLQHTGFRCVVNVKD